MKQLYFAVIGVLAVDLSGLAIALALKIYKHPNSKNILSGAVASLIALALLLIYERIKKHGKART
jgi:hypothetical protein